MDDCVTLSRCHALPHINMKPMCEAAFWRRTRLAFRKKKSSVVIKKQPCEERVVGAGRLGRATRALRSPKILRNFCPRGIVLPSGTSGTGTPWGTVP